jgi:hypothetical protein
MTPVVHLTSLLVTHGSDHRSLLHSYLMTAVVLHVIHPHLVEDFT